MDFEEFKKKSGYREEPIVSFDRWVLNMFDADRSGALSVKAERKAKEKYEKTHNLQEEYAAYVSSIEARNAQSLRQLLAQWEAQTGQENYKAAQSELTTRAEREKMQQLENSAKTKKILIIAAAAVAAIIFLRIKL